MNIKNEVEILTIELEMNYNIIDNCSDDCLESKEIIEQCKHQISVIFDILRGM